MCFEVSENQYAENSVWKQISALRGLHFVDSERKASQERKCYISTHTDGVTLGNKKMFSGGKVDLLLRLWISLSFLTSDLKSFLHFLESVVQNNFSLT